MDQTTLVAVGVGVLGVVGTALGAVIGGLVSLYVQRSAEADREAREARAFRAELRSDLLWWATVCREAAEFRLTADHSRNLVWRDVAARAAVHLPDGLAILAFQVFLQRTMTESAYRDLSTTGIEGLNRVLAVQFEFRRWAVMAGTFVRWLDSAERNSQLKRPYDSAGERALISEFLTECQSTLVRQHGYKLDEEGGLHDEQFTPERLDVVAAAYEAMRRAARQDRGN